MNLMLNLTFRLRILLRHLRLLYPNLMVKRQKCTGQYCYWIDYWKLLVGVYSMWQFFRGGKICLSDHFKPLWARNVPKFGIAQAFSLGLGPWLAVEVPELVSRGAIQPKQTEASWAIAVFWFITRLSFHTI